MERGSKRQGTSAIRSALWAFVGVAAPALIALAMLIPDHAAESVREEAASAAGGAAEALGALWQRELMDDAPFGAPPPLVVPREVERPPQAAPAPSGEERLRWLATRATAGGTSADALTEVIEGGGPFADEAAVALAWLVADGAVDAGTLARALASLGFDRASGQVEARPLALLIARDRLTTATVAEELDALRTAFLDGSLWPADRAREVDGRFAFEADAVWAAWRELLRAAFPEHDVDAAFVVDVRRSRAIARAAAERVPLPGGRWTPVPTVDAPDELLLVRATDAALEVTRIRAADVDARLAEGLPGEAAWAWSVRAFDEGSDSAQPLTVTGSLTGTDVTAELRSRSLDARIAGAEREVLWLRIAGVAVALALAAAAVATLRSLRELERLWRLRSTFVASVSHDLRTPVASIGLMAENLAAGHARGREGAYAEAIRAESDRLARLVDDLLDFGRIERGLPARVVPERVVVAPWLEAFTAGEAQKCRARDRVLAVTLADLPHAATLDRLALERAISNLVDNALAHAGGARIELVVRGVEGGRRLRFDVLDEGAGVSAARIESLFEPFARGETTGEGTGLGLAIVRSIAESHGGSAALERRDDGPSGMRARIEIPTGSERAA